MRIIIYIFFMKFPLNFFRSMFKILFSEAFLTVIKVFLWYNF